MTEPAIEMRKVSKHYRYFALDNISLELASGQIMGLIGARRARQLALST